MMIALVNHELYIFYYVSSTNLLQESLFFPYVLIKKSLRKHPDIYDSMQPHLFFRMVKITGQLLSFIRSSSKSNRWSLYVDADSSPNSEEIEIVKHPRNKILVPK